MIFVTKLNGESYLLNNRHIETAEEKPDSTTITLTSGKVVIVKEPLDVLQSKIVEFELTVSNQAIG